jgi:hypothetical protein
LAIFLARVNPAGKVTNELSTFILLKMAERSEAWLRVKISRILIFVVKLRFALLASLR